MKLGDREVKGEAVRKLSQAQSRNDAINDGMRSGRAQLIDALMKVVFDMMNPASGIRVVSGLCQYGLEDD